MEKLKHFKFIIYNDTEKLLHLFPKLKDKKERIKFFSENKFFKEGLIKHFDSSLYVGASSFEENLKISIGRGDYIFTSGKITSPSLESSLEILANYLPIQPDLLQILRLTQSSKGIVPLYRIKWGGDFCSIYSKGRGMENDYFKSGEFYDKITEIIVKPFQHSPKS